MLSNSLIGTSIEVMEEVDSKLELISSKPIVETCELDMLPIVSKIVKLG